MEIASYRGSMLSVSRQHVEIAAGWYNDYDMTDEPPVTFFTTLILVLLHG